MPSTSSARPLFLTDDPALLDDLLRLAAAANVDVTVVSSAARSSRYWAQAPLVVVGTDLVGVLARAEPPRHAHAVVVSRTPSPRPWTSASTPTPCGSAPETFSSYPMQNSSWWRSSPNPPTMPGKKPWSSP